MSKLNSNETPARIRDPAPEFETNAYSKGIVNLSLREYRGKYVVIFWYPSDFSPLCSTEIVALSDRIEEFKKLKCEVIGASTDIIYSHVEFCEKLQSQGSAREIKFPLLSDSNLEICKAYGCLDENRGIALRATYIIDEKGIIRHISMNDPSTARNLDEILRLVDAFQYSDEFAEECPFAGILERQMMKKGMEFSESHEAFTTKRDQYSIEIRKKKTEDIINLKRIRFSQDKLAEAEAKELSAYTPNQLSEYFMKVADRFFAAYNKLGMMGLRPILKEIRLSISSQAGGTYGNYIIETKMLPIIARFLDEDFIQHDDLQDEAAWIISNVAAGGSLDTQYVVNELEALDRYLNLLQYQIQLHVKESVFWGLANIIVDNPAVYGKICIERKLIPIIVSLLEDPFSNPGLLQTLTWLMHQICKARPPFEQVAPFLPSIERFLNGTDEKIISNVVWSLSCIALGNDDVIEEVLDLECTHRVIACAGWEELSIKLPSLSVLGLLLSGNDDQTIRILKHDGLIPTLLKCLDHVKNSIRREATWALSNICGGSKEIIQHVIKYPNLIETLIAKIYADEKEIVREVLYCFRNCIRNAESAELKMLLDKGLMRALIHILNSSKASELLILALTALGEILEVGNQMMLMGAEVNVYLLIFESEGGVRVIEKLQSHKDDEVYKIVEEIINSFFTAEDQ